LAVNSRMHLIVAITSISIVGIVLLLIFINIDKKDKNIKPVQLTLSLISDNRFLNSIKVG